MPTVVTMPRAKRSNEICTSSINRKTFQFLNSIEKTCYTKIQNQVKNLFQRTYFWYFQFQCQFYVMWWQTCNKKNIEIHCQTSFLGGKHKKNNFENKFSKPQPDSPTYTLKTQRCLLHVFGVHATYLKKFTMCNQIHKKLSYKTNL